MYRCYVCDHPAQTGCGCDELPQEKETDYNSNSDPFGWEEDEQKKDISSGEGVMC